jgi:hypothetical protein
VWKVGSDKRKVLAVIPVAIAFLQDELVDNIFNHQYQTIDPEDIDDDIIFVVKSETQ